MTPGLVRCHSERAARGDTIITVVRLDLHHTHRAWVELDLHELGRAADGTFQVHDRLGGARRAWRGARDHVELVPDAMPAHVFEVRRHARSEHPFEYCP